MNSSKKTWFAFPYILWIIGFTMIPLGLVFYYTSEEADPYVYCMEQDDFGITYHRFSRPDYNKLVSEDNEIKHNAQECIMCK